MVSMRNLALAASTLVGLANAAPAVLDDRQAFVPGKANNTRDFYLKMVVAEGLPTYDGYTLEAYHTGAGLADPCFTSGKGSAAYLNNTNLQFDIGYLLAANAFTGDTNYARWELVPLGVGYGSGGFFFNGTAGLVTNQPEFDGWLVCEWYHGINVPQLFQLIKGFDSPSTVFPSSCARAVLLPEYI